MKEDNVTPFLAVWIVTYNHGDFIEQAIDSVLMQKTDFPIKLFIGEDFSTDLTAEICKKKKEEYPKLIELFINTKNIGANNNSQRIYEACMNSQAKYTALLEGDDYWTDPLKLQKQVDFLESNSDFSLCFHNSNVLNSVNGTETLFRSSSKKIYNTRDVILSKWFCPTASVVYRNSILRNGIYLERDKKIVNQDQLLLLSASLHGKLYYMDDVMSTYRFGVIGSASNKYNKILERYNNILYYLKYINRITKGKFLIYISIKRIYIFLGIFKNVILKKK